MAAQNLPSFVQLVDSRQGLLVTRQRLHPPSPTEQPMEI
jgi:hypothetical protein